MDGIKGESEYWERFPVSDLASGITRCGDEIWLEDLRTVSK
jgi:hypothetical protein